MGKIYHIFCDESRQSCDRYMVLGGIIIPQDSLITLDNTMLKYRNEEKMDKELKWTKVTDKYLTKYLKFIDYFFALNNTDAIHFHSLILDNHKINHKKYSKGDKEIGFYKFYYQLFLHRFGTYYCNNKEQAKLVIHVDDRRSNYKLNDLKEILNRGICSKCDLNYNPVVSIQAKDSKDSELIQLDDIILGAIGFEKNGYHLLGNTRESKKELCKYISGKAGIINLSKNTFYNQRRFTIWNFKLRE